MTESAASETTPRSSAARWKALFPEPVAVLGFGLEGRSTLHHLRAQGYRDITVLDRVAPADPLPAGVRGVFGEDYLAGLDAAFGIRTAFRAPGLRPFVPEIEAFQNRGGLLTSQVEATFALLGRDRIVGVTGTVGKGTCCSLLAGMLSSADIPYRLAGNIGRPPLDTLDEIASLPPHALLVLELSSFQLSTLHESPKTAIVLRTTTEHLDWHATREEYWDHKANLTRFQQPGDTCVYFGGVEGSSWIGGLSAGHRVCVRDVPPHDADRARPPDEIVQISGTEFEWESRGLHLALTDTRMTGTFNLENIAAAAAAALTLGTSLAAIAEGAAHFAPLEHRIEFVRTHDGIRYFNDSYATRPEATLAAVQAFRPFPHESDLVRAEPLGLILGGSEKFADFAELAHKLAQESHLHAIALIGQTAERIEKELHHAGALNGRAVKRCATLEEAVRYLRHEIGEGVVLLSPACASFGLFANYKERGKAFKVLVSSL